MIGEAKAPRNMVGRIEGGRAGGNQPKMLGHTASAGSRIIGSNELHRGAAALQRAHRHIEHGKMVGHEEGIELAALQGLGERSDARKLKLASGNAPG